MKYAIILLFCIVVIIFASIYYPQQYTTPEQAMEAVRSFEGNPSLQFSYVEMAETDAVTMWDSSRYSYDLKHVYYPDDRNWSVNAITGEVYYAIYGDAYPERADDPFGPLTKEECRQIAENFARAKYADFDTMNFQPYEEWGDTGWYFSWWQLLDYGAKGYNDLAIEVNPADGHIQMYSSRRIPSFTVLEPHVISQKAVDIAMQTTGIVTLDSAAPELNANPDGTFWEFEISGDNAQGKYLRSYIKIDAVSGNVLDVSNSGISQ
ncbi:MAG: PepSY domain-containing protein [Armatimonadota bacterium]